MKKTWHRIVLTELDKKTLEEKGMKITFPCPNCEGKIVIGGSMKRMGILCKGAKSTFTLSKSEIIKLCESSLLKKGYSIEESKLNVSKTGRVSVTVRCA